MPRAGGCIRAPNTVFIDHFMLFLWAVAKITPNERQMVDREDETGSVIWRGVPRTLFSSLSESGYVHFLIREHF